MDPKDCRNPVCHSKIKMFSSSLAQKAFVGAVPPDRAAETPLECPVDRDELGRSTWNLLHTTAAYFPEQPTDTDKHQARGLVEGLAAHYPCDHCREDFKESIEEDPPSLGSRTQFALWLCRQHNKVNEKLGKSAFPCTIQNIDRRWKYGGPECWSAEYDGYAHETLGKDLDEDEP
ncbi:hypothetical protein CTAYLR_007665 [Chrysophaeum taylorii]|uniref:Sulfhydryl oxidase n=1 Tax=Chrysophaeum taylorii TaxID=2483200 RepID=A0AAD7U8C3_9STRA|nr:hypothetical protein CTAYLR_007665 [Chrysophaeum taylorii]